MGGDYRLDECMAAAAVLGLRIPSREDYQRTVIPSWPFYYRTLLRRYDGSSLWLPRGGMPHRVTRCA
jgi:hypothetical protein